GQLGSAFGWARRPKLDATRKASRRVADQINDHFRDIVRRELPVSRWTAWRFTAGEAGRDRTRHDIADADVVVTNFLHQSFTEGVDRRFRGAVRRATGEGVLAGQAADVDDPAAAAP